MKFTGIDIGGTKCAVISGSAETGIQDKIKFATTNVDETIENIIKAVEKLGVCDAIGISCGGPLDSKRGDADAIRVYDICAEKLGAGLSVLIDILNPEKIVIGSVFERSEELLRDKMEKVINAETLSYAKEVCEIVPAQLGDSIGDWAAIAVAENTLCG